LAHLSLFKKISAWLGNSDHPSSVSRHRSFFNQYDAAASGRRLRLWQPAQLGPNAALLGNLTNLRTRSRDATRNNAWIKHGIGNYVSNEVGVGIMPKSLAPKVI
jgi:capsid protein